MSIMVDLETLKTPSELALEFGITSRRIRQVCEKMDLGFYIAGSFLVLTPAECEQIRQRRTDRTPIHCWLKERSKRVSV